MPRLCLSYLLSRGLNRGFAEWGGFRETYSALERWFRKGVVTEGEWTERRDWTIGELEDALLCRADAIAFLNRTLWGLKEYETSDSYWTLNPPKPPEPGPSSTADMEYFCRYLNMQRIDVFHLTGNDTVLKGGHSYMCESSIEALQAYLKVPRTIRFVSGEESTQCEFSSAWNTRDGRHARLVVNISYTGTCKAGTTQTGLD